MTPDQRSHSPSYGLKTKSKKDNSKPREKNPLHKFPSKPRYILTCNKCDLEDESHFYEDMEKVRDNHICDGEPKIYRLARCKL
jgi:hypothetical protein